MKTRPAIALGILLVSCQAGSAFAARTAAFTGQRLGSCGNLPARLAQNLSTSPWTGDGQTGCVHMADGRVKIQARPAGTNPDPRQYAQITVTPDHGWSLEEVQVSWRVLSPASGTAVQGATQAEAWAFAGTNENAAAAFGSFNAPSNRFAFLNWTPKLQAESGQPITLRFYAWSTGQTGDSTVLVLDDVRLSGRMVAVSPSTAERVSPVVVVLCDFASSISNALASLQHISTTQSLVALVHELRDLQQATRTSLFGAGLITVSALLSFLLAAWVLLRAQAWSSTRAAKPDEVTSARDVASGAATSGSPGGRGDASAAVQQATARYLGALERLEKRIRGLEQSAPAPGCSADTLDASTGSDCCAAQKAPVAGTTATDRVRPSEALPPMNATLQFDALLGKGQALFSLNQHERAQQCFAEASRLQPDNTDALVRNGLALERLQRFDEAIACYDRAITLDPSLSMAWLHLGRICNRLERHQEAFACYERAVKKEPRSLNAPS